MKTRSITAASILAAVASLAVAGCGGASDSTDKASSDSGRGGTKLSLVAYSVPKVGFDKVIPLFQQTTAGKGVTFSQSFGASGSQSRAVDSGQPADVVAFSTTPDMTRLVKDAIVSSSWIALFGCRPTP